MFKNLRTSTKLLILCAMFIVPIAVATYGLVAEKQVAIAFARKELVGSRYLATVREIFAAILIGQPDGTSMTQPVRSPDEITKALTTAEAETGGIIQTAELAQALLKALKALWSQRAAGENTDTLTLEALTSARALASRIGDDTNLALDPDLDTYYVQGIIVGKLPLLASQLGEIQALLRSQIAAGTLSIGSPTDFRIRESLIQSTLDGVRSDLAAAYRGSVDGSLKPAVDADLVIMFSHIGSYLNAVNASIESGVNGIDPAPLNRAYVDAVGSTINGWAIAQTELDRLIRKRIDGFVGRMRLSLAFTSFLVGLSILVAVVTHRHITNSLRRLESIAKKVTDTKCYSHRVAHNTQDEMSGLAVAFNDMLAELAAAREREVADQAELARVTQLTTMGQMAASIAHEINQPLAAIVTNGNAGLRWLSNPTPNFDEAKAALNRIVSDGHRASAVIGTIRSMFKKEGQRKAPLSVNELISAVLGLMNGELENHRISVQTELHKELPPVTADRVQLQQVFLNLIANAVDAMDSISDRARILRVSTKLHESDSVLITIEDSGTGIDPANASRIFDAFYTTKTQGMGIGLAICRSIIEAHDGRLSVSPGTPHGSKFQIVFPAGGFGAER